MDRKIIKKTGEARVEVKKSKFIGIAAAVDSEESASQLLKEIRKEHSLAKHVCYAYSIGDTNPRMKFSDDGEPGGTAGKPILDVVAGSGVQNIIIIVVRYFGGILLGTGGLVRAYTDAAREALSSAEIITEVKCLSYDLGVQYSDFDSVKYILDNEEGVSTEMEYGEGVTIHALIPEVSAEEIIKKISEKTAGRTLVNLDHSQKWSSSMT